MKEHILKMFCLSSVLVLLLAGCNSPPATPEQRAFLQQRLQHQNEMLMQQSKPTYQVVQPVQQQQRLNTTCQRFGAAVNCTSY